MRKLDIDITFDDYQSSMQLQMNQQQQNNNKAHPFAENP
jgi:hypothetical protein